MPARIGLDVGSASVKLAAILGPGEAEALSKSLTGSSAFRFVAESPEKWRASSLSPIIVSECRRSLGNPYQAALDLLHEFQMLLPDSWQVVLRVTGSGGHRVAEALNTPFENEFKAIARGVSALYPQIRTVFEMGGENSKYLLLDGSRSSNGEGSADLSGCSAGILDYSTSSQCAAGHRLVHRPAGVTAAIPRGRHWRGRLESKFYGPHRRTLLGVCQIRHDSRATEGLHHGGGAEGIVRSGLTEFQKQYRQGPQGSSACCIHWRRLAERRSRPEFGGCLPPCS